MLRSFPFRLAFLLGVVFITVGSAFAQMVVVVNARSGVATMARNEVVNIFFGRYRQFFNGLEAQPVDLHEDNPDRERFYVALAGQTNVQVSAYWARQVFAGHTKPPHRVRTDEEVLKWVSSHPGGIGYMELNKADARVRVVLELKP